ncbi:MAG: hypothetical protein HC939_23845 [Pleurocapsa sp. SU_5_0]|nr:hypothetical protein [Pleurocapsa sp. SU_5_0]
MFSLIKHRINQIYLDRSCIYLYTDEYGNLIYLATTSHSNFTKRLTISEDRQYCTVSYYADGYCFYQESLNLALYLLCYA